MAIVPSRRVSVEDFFALLKQNGLSPRAVGSGSGQVVDADGNKIRVGGILVIAIPLAESERTLTLARLCGITAASEN
jgi:hypothetical protein